MGRLIENGYFLGCRGGRDTRDTGIIGFSILLEVVVRDWSPRD